MNQTQDTNNYGIVYRYAAIIGLGSCVFGFFIGIFNSLQAYQIYYNNLQNNESQKNIFIGLCNSLLCIGAIVGCLICSVFFKFKIKYKAISAVNDILGIIGCLILIIDLSPRYIYIGRFICGVYSGIQSSIAQVYMKDISPSEIVGQVGTFNQLLITIGLAISFGISFIIPQQYNFIAITDQEIQKLLIEYKMRVQLINVIPIIIQILRQLLFIQIKLNLPNNNIKEYETYFAKIYSTEEQMQFKIQEIKHSVVLRNSYQGQSVNLDNNDENNSLWKRLTVGFILSSLSQLTGINAIIFYSNDIFQKMGSGESAKVYTFILGILQIMFTLVSTKYIEKYGRRYLLLIGQLLITIGLVLIGVSSYYNVGYLSVVSICVHLLGFSISFGSVVWIYLVDILKETYISLMSLNSWLFTIFISFLVPILISYTGVCSTFVIFAGFNVITFIFVYLYVVETKGKTFIQISNEYNQINTAVDINHVPHFELL